ncbi:MAG: hypothetical protein M0P39_06050 [Rhodocyclaceae bacterium]|nr:hypothetical protein [Rhodocyclaceae bacterium]
MATINIVPIANQSEEELRRAGWKKQTTLEGGRLQEVAEGYRTLGYEVFVEEYRAEEGCTTCFGTGKEMGQIHGTVWIRPGSGKRSDNELFD